MAKTSGAQRTGHLIKIICL